MPFAKKRGQYALCPYIGANAFLEKFMNLFHIFIGLSSMRFCC